jgi:hypothetical protein
MIKATAEFDSSVAGIGPSPERLCHAENDVPQPQVPVALGLANLKPPP